MTSTTVATEERSSHEPKMEPRTRKQGRIRLTERDTPEVDWYFRTSRISRWPGFSQSPDEVAAIHPRPAGDQWARVKKGHRPPVQIGGVASLEVIQMREMRAARRCQQTVLCDCSRRIVAWRSYDVGNLQPRRHIRW